MLYFLRKLQMGGQRWEAKRDTRKALHFYFSLGFSPSGSSHFHTILFKVCIKVIHALLMTQQLPKKERHWMTLVYHLGAYFGECEFHGDLNSLSFFFFWFLS